MCIKVEAPEKVSGEGTMTALPLDLTRYAGCPLFFPGPAEAENVSEPSRSYCDFKDMFHVVSHR